MNGAVQGLMVDTQTALNLALSIVAFFGGWFVRIIREDIKGLQASDKAMSEALNNLRVDLPSHYVSKPDFQEMGNNIFASLRRIEDKIDLKVDKP